MFFETACRAIKRDDANDEKESCVCSTEDFPSDTGTLFLVRLCI